MRRSITILLATLALVLVAVVPTADATQKVQRAWRSSLGGGTRGQEGLTAYTDGTARLEMNLVGMKASASYAPKIRAGTCAKPGIVLLNVGPLVTDGTGAASSTRMLSNTIMNRIWGVARGGYINIRFTSGTSVICGDLRYFVATRVRFPGYKIDMPVVRGPNGYPYCNVAMYQTILWQPAEPGVAFLYAHARVGMFLPLLTASKVNNGAAMVGKLIYVYTSDSLMYTYKVTRVRRHIRSIQSAVSISYEKLWLQTSEGPNFTYPKLIVEASRIAVAPATYAASHPTPHIVHCS
jgi:hypothetical protein